jgi:PKD repeat protein
MLFKSRIIKAYMKHIFTLGLFVLAAFTLQAQHSKQPIQGEGIPVGKKSEVKTVPLFKEITHSKSDVKWMTNVTRIATYHKQPDSVSIMKAAKALVKDANESSGGNSIVQNAEGSGRATTPVLGTNFLGNEIPYGTPPDNAMAISNGGRIVSSDNGTIEYYTEAGQYVLINESHSDFFNDNSLTGSIFDPRLIYDSQADRFIFVILHGSSSTTSQVLIAFSKTNNPSNGWWMYSVSRNPVNNNCWLDYPNIGVSNNELYISGNLFTDNDNYNQSVLYQISKSEGYAGQSLSYQLWQDVEDDQGASAFTLVPLSYGQQGNYGPGIYLASARSGGSNKLFIYDLTDDMSASNEQLLAYSANVSSYSPAADAYQPGSAPDLNNNDCRLQHGFYLDGYVHAVHHADYNNTAYNGVNYYRVPLSNLNGANQSSFGENNKDCSFPSLASFAMQANERSVMIGYLSVSSSSAPGMRAVNCDENMNWSSSSLIKNGDTYVDYSWLSGTERWGDYSDLQRKHSATTPEVWMAGCFGATGPVNHTWNTWIAEIKGEYTPLPLTVAGFTADTTIGYNPAVINFQDTSSNNPTAWFWTFEGGTPGISVSQNPTVTYIDTGMFDVTLAVTNQYGSDTLTKEEYITVLNSDTVVITPESVNEIDIQSLRVYPNPVAAYELMYLDIDVQVASMVQVEIIDMQGKKVKTLLDDRLKSGLHRLSFNTMALAAGQYVVQINVNNQTTHNEKIIVTH